MTTITLAEVEHLAETAHADQTDKTGAPYIGHVRAVAAALAPFGPELQMAGLLHDTLEDTSLTAGQLRTAGVPDRVVDIVEAVTNQPGTSYQDKIRRITADPDATLVKIADNADNSRPDRAALLPAVTRDRLTAKYRTARTALWAAADPADIRTIITIANPSLTSELTSG
ncbi:HD domain-containing protein [Streptomyces europaeiscabiei]|uniref:HD domain-containing protein n=1 Tax=Streptomyces europaeiscabiei TaxID=146819 RepID=UPI0029A9B29D|nr:HD domain-containing protein [Streptomyces europaeiscabiei]MDX3695032.1 HD domain-containing protein [Streptomyces europaeiscabiei]